MGADLCTDSQAWVLRNAGVLRWPTWTNSFADNDVNGWSAANGGTADDHPAATNYASACCVNVTPARSTDKTIAGIRVVHLRDVEDQDWSTAARTCSAFNADLCDKGQYVALRAAGAITVKVWASDHSDNDSGVAAESLLAVSDNTQPDLQSMSFGFACCAGATTPTCPVAKTGGVCAVQIQNTAGPWPSAAQDCSSRGARVCSISQSALLRSANALTAVANWVGSRGDNDGNNVVVGVGQLPDNPPIGSMAAWACCP